jgi:hypothetical protein
MRDGRKAERQEPNATSGKVRRWSTRAMVAVVGLSLLLGGASAIVYTHSGGTVNLPIPTTYTVTGQSSANWPTAPTVSLATNTVGPCGAATSNDVLDSGGVAPLNATTAGANVGADCHSGDWVLMVSFTSAGTIVAGVDTFQFLVTWTGMETNGAQETYPTGGTQTLTQAATFGAGSSVFVIGFALDFGTTAGPYQIASVSCSVTGV